MISAYVHTTRVGHTNPGAHRHVCTYVCINFNHHLQFYVHIHIQHVFLSPGKKQYIYVISRVKYARRRRSHNHFNMKIYENMLKTVLFLMVI